MANSFYDQLLAATGKGTPNYSFYAVPVMWLLSISAHFYAINLTKGQFTNSSPRQYLAEVQSKPKKTATDKAIIRAEAANANGFENLAFFAAAIVAGNMAKLPAEELNSLAGGYLVSRFFFNILYIFVTSESASFLRSVTYLVGVGINWTLFIKAGLALQ